LEVSESENIRMLNPIKLPLVFAMLVIAAPLI